MVVAAVLSSLRAGVCLRCGWGFAESLCWSMSVIIGKAWYMLVHRVKASIGTGTGSKTKLRVQASSGTGWKTSTDIA